MKRLNTLAGVSYHPVLRFLDSTQGPMQCELVVHPHQGWAVATEQPEKGRPGLIHCAPTLAAKICREFGVSFDALVLLTRYVYAPGQESFYVQRFGHGEVDLFETARFFGPMRDPLMEPQVEELLRSLDSGQGLRREWRSLAQSSAAGDKSH